jgi:hypothetical protein
MTEASFAQKMVWSAQLKYPDPIITAPEPIFVVNQDKRLLDPQIKDADKPLCIGRFDSNSSFCKSCEDKEGCEAYKDDIENEKESHRSSFEVK